MDVQADIVEQLRRDFPEAEINDRLAQLLAATESPRLQRCIVVAARGRPLQFDYLCKLVRIDFRNVIMAAEYDRDDVQLYDFRLPIPEAGISHKKS